MMTNKATDTLDFPIYEDLQDKAFKDGILNFLLPVKKIVENYFMKWDNIGKNTDTVIEIVNLIQKRRVYFHIFHKKKMGEVNELSLICFWILKLRPFYYKPNPNRNINLVIAVNLFRHSITKIAKKKGIKIDFPITHLLHAFKYRDLSKEAIMAIAESLIS